MESLLQLVLLHLSYWQSPTGRDGETDRDYQSPPAEARITVEIVKEKLYLFVSSWNEMDVNLKSNSDQIEEESV